MRPLAFSLLLSSASAAMKLRKDGVIFDSESVSSTFVTSQQFIDGLTKSDIERNPTRQGTSFYKHTGITTFDMLNGYTFTDTSSTAKIQSQNNKEAIAELLVWDPDQLEVPLPVNQRLEVTARLQVKLKSGGDSDPGLMLADAAGVSAPGEGSMGGGNFIGAMLHDLSNKHCLLGFDDSATPNALARRFSTNICTDNDASSGPGSFEYTELKWVIGANMPNTLFTVSIFSTGSTELPSSTTREIPVQISASNKLFLRLYTGNPGEVYEFRALEVSVKHAFHERAARFSDPVRARSPLFIGGLRWTDPNYVLNYNGYTWTHSDRSNSPGAGATTLQQTSLETSMLAGYIPVLQPGAFNGIFPGAARLEVRVRLAYIPQTQDSDIAFGISAPIKEGESGSAFGGTAPFWATVTHEQGGCLIGMDDSVTLAATGSARRLSVNLCSTSSTQMVEQVWYIGAGLDTSLELSVLTPSVYGTPTTTYKGRHNVVIDPDLGVGIRFYGNNVGETYQLQFMDIKIDPA